MKKRLISVVVLILYGTICAESYGTNSGHNSQHYHHHNHGDTNNRHQGGSGEGGGSSSPTGGFSSKVEAILQWKQMEIEGLMEVPGRGSFLYPSELDMLAASNFTQYNNVPLGVDYYDGRLFVTLPRRQFGVPVTLAFVNIPSATQSPKLIPYPDLKTNLLPTQPDPDRIVSVYRTRIDNCGRLWFVDTGMFEPPGNATQIQPASIWVIDTHTNRRIRRFEFPKNLVNEGKGMISITVDVQPGNCNNAFAYIPDIFTRRLYVYSFGQNKVWHFQHSSFDPNSPDSDFNVAGLSYRWNDGIFSLTLGPLKPDGYRAVFYHPMSSTNEFVVSSKVLQNQGVSENPASYETFFKFYGTRGPLTQSSMHQYDQRNGIMMYTQVARNAVACWNSQKPYTAENIGLVAQSNETMIYPSDLKVDRESNVWYMTNSMPIFVFSKLDTNEYNFRVWRGKISEIIKGTVCE